MFYLIDKTGKNILAWGDGPPPIEDSNTQEIIEIPGSIRPGFQGFDSKIVAGVVQNLSSAEKNSATQARKSKRNSARWNEFKTLAQDNLADLKNLLGIT